MPLDKLFLGPGQTAIEEGELLVEVFVPSPPPNSSGRYLRLIPREEMDIAVAGAATMVALDPASGRCSTAGIALAAVAPTPVRAREAEEVLEGRVITPDLIREAADLASGAPSPITDVRGSVGYQRELCRVLTRRTLEACLADLGA